MEINVSNLKKTFLKDREEILALNDISWNAGAGDVIAVIGPNGSGKSTMLRIILGLLPASAGTVRIDGVEQFGTRRSFLSRLGFLPEERGLYPRERVLPMLIYLGELKGLTTEVAKKSAEELLDRFQLAEWKNERVEKLSKGMAQRVQVIAAILHDPELVVMDEPFYGLDPVGMNEIRVLIRDLAAAGKLVIISTHAMNEVQNLSNLILMLNRGRRVLFGNTIEIRQAQKASHIVIDSKTSLDGIDFIESVRNLKNEKQVFLKPGFEISDLLQALIELKRCPIRFELALPSLDDVFLNEVAKGEGNGH